MHYEQTMSTVPICIINQGDWQCKSNVAMKQTVGTKIILFFPFVFVNHHKFSQIGKTISS